MNDDKPLTGVRKRTQIASANQQMLIWVAGAAVVVSVCAVLAVNFVQRIVYQGEVNKELGVTNAILKTDVDNIKQLVADVNGLGKSDNKDPEQDTPKQNPLTLPNLMSDGSTPFQVVLDALPTTNDGVSLGASLQSKVLPVRAKQITVISSGTSSATTTTSDSSSWPTAQPITFSFEIDASYDQIQEALRSIEKTIRPIMITSIKLQGTGSNLQATFSATTYYVPKVDFQLGSKTVPFGNETATTTATNTTGGTQ